MGCVEHHCKECKNVHVSNNSNKDGKEICPECGGNEFLSVFDEEFDHD